MKFVTFVLVLLFVALFAVPAKANVPDYLTISGPNNVCVGKTNVFYSLEYFIQGTFLSCSIWVSIDGDYIASNMFHETETFIRFDAPTNECTLKIEADLWYERNSYSQHYVYLQATKYVSVQKPDLQNIRLGLDEISYTNFITTVPIHWNIDDDDRSGYGGGTNTVYGEDDRQYVFLPNNFKSYDDDLYSIQAYIGNTALNTTRCDLKIKTSWALRLWYGQNKSALCCDSNSVFETNCNIRVWFNNKANSTGNRLYAEWVGELPMATNAFVEFYCNNVQFAKLRYKGYAVTKGGLPNNSERVFFETNYYFLNGCEWQIAPNGGHHEHDHNSLAEAVDPKWRRYGEPFVATTSSPFGTNIYVLQNSIYNTFPCRCISMDTFGNQSHTFEESDATAFFTIYNFWQNTFYDIGSAVLYSDIIYYNGQFAARKADLNLRENCYSSWAMVTSRFFNRPKIIHRAEQLGPIKTIQKTYLIGPSPN